MTDNENEAAAFLTKDLAKALQHLRLALVCLDEAAELQAPPYVQMAIDALLGLTDDEPDGGSIR